jgi:uncharacterized phiE125 gp8 family phage protein
MPVGPFALTTLADVKEHLRIEAADSTEDTFLEKLIDRCTSRIESYVNRKLKKRSYTELYDGSGTQKLLLNQFPITALTSVNIDQGQDFLPSTDVDIEAIVIQAEEGLLSWSGVVNSSSAFNAGIWSAGVRNIQVVYEAGYDPIPDDLAAACIKLVAVEFNRAREGADAFTAEGTAGHSVTWIQGMPQEIDEMLLAYRRPY